MSIYFIAPCQSHHQIVLIFQKKSSLMHNNNIIIICFWCWWKYKKFITQVFFRYIIKISCCFWKHIHIVVRNDDNINRYDFGLKVILCESTDKKQLITGHQKGYQTMTIIYHCPVVESLWKIMMVVLIMTFLITTTRYVTHL